MMPSGPEPIRLTATRAVSGPPAMSRMTEAIRCLACPRRDEAEVASYGDDRNSPLGPRREFKRAQNDAGRPVVQRPERQIPGTRGRGEGDRSLDSQRYALCFVRCFDNRVGSTICAAARRARRGIADGCPSCPSCATCRPATLRHPARSHASAFARTPRIAGREARIRSPSARFLEGGPPCPPIHDRPSVGNVGDAPCLRFRRDLSRRCRTRHDWRHRDPLISFRANSAARSTKPTPRTIGHPGSGCGGCRRSSSRRFSTSASWPA